MKSGTLFGIALLLQSLAVVAPAPAAAQALTYDEVRTAMDAAEAEAERNDWNLTIVVVDAEGVPIYLRRMPDASPRSYDIAMGKVRTALAAGMHTNEYAEALSAGRVDSIPNGITFEGGYLIRRGGEIVGAMSASGARGSEDAQAVRAGMSAIGVQP